MPQQSLFSHMLVIKAADAKSPVQSRKSIPSAQRRINAEPSLIDDRTSISDIPDSDSETTRSSTPERESSIAHYILPLPTIHCTRTRVVHAPARYKPYDLESRRRRNAFRMSAESTGESYNDEERSGGSGSLTVKKERKPYQRKRKVLDGVIIPLKPIRKVSQDPSFGVMPH